MLAFLVTACAGALMVSRFSYNSFKQFNLAGPVRFATFIIVPLIFVAIAVYPPTALLAVFGGYALSGPAAGCTGAARRPAPAPGGESGDEPPAAA